MIKISERNVTQRFENDDNDEMKMKNGDMESSKHCVEFLSLIFIIRCLSKSNLIGLSSRSFKNL